MNLSKWSWLVLLGLSLAVSACIPDGRPTTQLCDQLGSLEAGRVEIRALPRDVMYMASVTPERFEEIFALERRTIQVNRKIRTEELKGLLQACWQSRVEEGIRVNGEMISSEFGFWIDCRAKIRFYDEQGALQAEMFLDNLGRTATFGEQIYDPNKPLSSRLVELVWGAEELQD